MSLTKLVLRLVCLPGDLICWGLICLIRLLWGRNLRIENGCLVTELKKKSWPSRTWYKGWGATTFGHGIMFGAGQANEGIWEHELVHVEQFESECVQAALLAGVAFAANAPLWLYIPLVLHGFTNYAASVITAKLRGEENAYLGSHLEEAAYRSCCKK